MRAAVTGKGLRQTEVLEQLFHNLDQACCPTFPLVDVEPVAEPLHHHSKVVAMELEVVATDVLEQMIWDYWLNWWNVGLLY